MHSLHLDGCQVHDHGRERNSVSLLYGCTVIYHLWGENNHTQTIKLKQAHYSHIQCTKDRNSVKKTKEKGKNAAQKKIQILIVSLMRLNKKKTFVFSDSSSEKETNLTDFASKCMF